MKIVVFTGAGISQSAGLPVYRGPDGKYTPGSQNFVPPIVVDNKLTPAELHAACEELDKTKAFIDTLEPTHAHKVLASLEKDHEVKIYTQNIDGLHQKAGSTDVYELHGSIHRKKWSDDFSMERHDVVFFGEMVDYGLIEHGLSAIDEADVFVCIGSSCQVYPAADIAVHGFKRNYYRESTGQGDTRKFFIDPQYPFLSISRAVHIKKLADEGIDEFVEML